MTKPPRSLTGRLVPVVLSLLLLVVINPPRMIVSPSRTATFALAVRSRVVGTGLPSMVTGVPSCSMSC